MNKKIGGPIELLIILTIFLLGIICGVSFNEMKIDLSVIVQGVIGIWMAIIATIALNTWKKQKKAQFIDELTDTVHSYILSFQAVITSLRIAKIGIESHRDISDKKETLQHPEAIAFIKRDGERTSKAMQKEIEAIKPFLIKMKSLSIKGQVLNINDYHKCLNACNLLEWSYNQVVSFAFFIGNNSLYWDNPDVQKALDKILTIEPDIIEENLNKQNAEYLKFAGQAYKNV